MTPHELRLSALVTELLLEAQITPFGAQQLWKALGVDQTVDGDATAMRR
ncbi:hypothetical protein [Rathayibacter sp. SD072]|nr:hypothetical protein [Rathayibacter sp. SD072]MBO0982902.1 hypothetical protein [Rathayibacter sp. SD072]